MNEKKFPLDESLDEISPLRGLLDDFQEDKKSHQDTKEEEDRVIWEGEKYNDWT